MRDAARVLRKTTDPVSHALADWLEETADLHEVEVGIDGSHLNCGGDKPPACTCWDRPLAVARAINT